MGNSEPWAGRNPSSQSEPSKTRNPSLQSEPDISRNPIAKSEPTVLRNQKDEASQTRREEQKMSTVVQDTKTIEAISGYGVVSRLLIQRLRDGKPGDEISDMELKSVCGLDTGVGQKGYGALQTAIRYCISKGVVWDRMRGTGKIRCLDPNERMVKVKYYVDGGRRKTKRGLRVIGTVDRDKDLATEKARREHDIRVSQLLHAHVTLEPRTFRLLEKDAAVTKEVNKQALLDLLRNDDGHDEKVASQRD